MLKAPRSNAATITSGVSFESMKLCAMRPARPKAREDGIPGLDSVVSHYSPSMRLPFRSQFARFGHKPLAVLEPGKHFDLGPGELSQSDVAQARNLVLVQHENALQLAAFDYCRAGNQQRLPLATRKLGPPKQPRTQPCVCGQLDLHQERATRGVCGRDDLHYLAFQLRVVEGIDHDRNLLSCSYIPEIALVDGGFQSIATHILDSENRHAG